MKLDLIYITQHLPAEFLPSFINRLSPPTYVRLRRTCSQLNDRAETAVDQNKIAVLAKNRALYLVFQEDDPTDFIATYATEWLCRVSIEERHPIPDKTSIFGFHYSSIYMIYESKYNLTEAQMLDQDNAVIQLSKSRKYKYDVFSVDYFRDPDSLLDHLRSATGDITYIENYYEQCQPINIQLLMEPEFERFVGAVVCKCSLSPNFNLMNLFKPKLFVDLVLIEKWDEVSSMYSKFVQDVYNDVDTDNGDKIKCFSLSMYDGSLGSRGLSNDQLGNVPFIVVQRPTIREDYDTYNSIFAYYCETKKKKRRIILTAITDDDQICLQLSIVPADEFSQFVQQFIFVTYELPIFWVGHHYPIDNSCLYSLLEGAPSDQYPAIVQKYTADLLKHLNRKLKLDLIYMTNRLPQNFLSSFINKLSPTTYVRLRRTCSFMDSKAEEASERGELRVIVKNKSLYLDFEGDTDYMAYYSSEWWAHNSREDLVPIVDRNSIFHFLFTTVHINYIERDMTDVEKQEQDEAINALLLRLKYKYDSLRIDNYRDSDNLLNYIRNVSSDNTGLEIWNLDCPPLNIEFLKETEFERFLILHVVTPIKCDMSSDFRLMDLFKNRTLLELTSTDTWDEITPMFSQFLQDVYNEVDTMNEEGMKIFYLSVAGHFFRSEKLSSIYLGHVPFALLLGPNQKEGYKSYNPLFIYFCETKKNKRKVLMVANTDGKFNGIQIYVIPPNEMTWFVETLGFCLYESAHFVGDFHPIDNSCLYALLEEVSADQYPAIVQEYTSDIMEHINRHVTLYDTVHFPIQ